MKARKYAAGGGPTDTKKRKTSTVISSESRAAQRAGKEAQNVRRGESAQIAKKIAKDVTSQAGYKYPPTISGRKASGDVAGQARTYKTPAKYTRGELRSQFAEEASGRGVQPIYTTGQTLGNAPGREVSTRGVKPIATEPKRPTQGGPSTAARVAMGTERAGAIERSGGTYTMVDAKKRGIKLKYGGKIKK